MEFLLNSFQSTFMEFPREQKKILVTLIQPNLHAV